MEALGTTQIWGLSPAIDLQLPGVELDIEEVKNKPQMEQTVSEPLRILVAGSNDPRHILKTASRLKRHPYQKIEFYVLETQAILLARFLMLLSVIFAELPLQEKTQLFLEIYGSLHVSEKTNHFIHDQCKAIIKAITDDQTQSDLAKVIDLKHLKFRDRDDIEFVLKFWTNPQKQFNGADLWDVRSRQYLKARYDQKENIVDWDYNMKLLERKDTMLISKREYLSWRVTGNCFRLRDIVYSHCNRTLATVDNLKVEGLRVSKWGYFSDILTGPFIAFGTTSEHKSVYKKRNDIYTTDAHELSTLNVKSIIHEFLTGLVYVPDEMAIADAEHLFDITSQVKFNLLSCDPDETFTKKQKKLAGFFDIVYLGNVLAHRLPESANLCKNNGTIIVEGVEYLLDLRKEHITAYNEKVSQQAKDLGLKPQDSPYSFLVYKKIESNQTE